MNVIIENKKQKAGIFGIVIFGVKFFIKNSPKIFFFLLFSGIISSFLSVFSLFLTQHFFDSVQGVITGAVALKYAYAVLIAFGAVMIIGQVQDGVEEFLFHAMTDKIGGRMQLLIHKKMAEIEPLALEDTTVHDDISKADRGKWKVVSIICVFMGLFGFFIPYFVFVGIYLRNLSPKFIFAIIVVFVPTFIGQVIRTKIMTKFTDTAAPIRREYDYYYNAMTDRIYFKETRLLGAYTFFINKFLEAIKKLSKAEVSTNTRINWLDIAIAFISSLGYLGIIVMLITALLSGEISIGAFAAVLGSIGMMFGMMEHMMKNRMTLVAQGLGEAGNYVRFIRLPERNSKDKNCELDMTKGITAENIDFSYPNVTQKTIDNVSIKIAPGETVAVVGANGAGKSTLVRLLIGLYLPDNGKVSFNGVDTKASSFKTLFAKISGVFQKYQRYALTLKENVQISMIEEDRDIKTALDEAGVEIDDKTYPQGENTMLSRNFGGVDLSGGQWQRVSIARGLYRPHEVIVLDEPTAAIDPIEESRIYKKFIEITKDKTAIIVTHRLGSTKIADRVVVMDKGRIVGEGKHEGLLAACPVYKEMYESQAMWYG